MCRPRKIHLNKTVLFVTYSLEEGVLLPCNPLVDLVVRSCLAHALMHHPIKICAFHVEGTHIHFIFVVDNPDDIKGFAERFKTETAHRLNRILGRRKRTVWCEGYDSPVILTKESAIEKIAYIYSNPAKDGLTDSIDEYPGLTSWHQWLTGNYSREWSFASRVRFRELSEESHCREGYEKEASRITSFQLDKLNFEIDPNAWLDCFDVLEPEDRKFCNQAILKRVRELEDQYRKTRAEQGIQVVGRKRLLEQKMDLLYRPNRTGRRTLCISDNILRRKEFISTVKRLISRARDVYDIWIGGDLSMAYPLGLYPPAIPKLVHPIVFE